MVGAEAHGHDHQQHGCQCHELPAQAQVRAVAAQHARQQRRARCNQITATLDEGQQLARLLGILQVILRHHQR